MKEIIAHQMQYDGGKIDSNLETVNYSDIYYEEYKAVYNDCFRPMRMALKLSPDCCDTREQLIKKQSDIYLLIVGNDIVGSVATYGNEIDDLFVNPVYQRKGYGKKLLLFAISSLQKKGKGRIFLHIADWNSKAINLYLKNGFKCIKTEKVL
jgi:GNAT superfamily N-acetyltransferase